MQRNNVIDSLISGSLSSTITTIAYQPLELLKTRLQLQKCDTKLDRGPIGRSTRSTLGLLNTYGIRYFWRGTVPSLVRSVPGVSIYYVILNLFQKKLSSRHDRPDTISQAFLMGLASRSLVSVILLPATVVKVRYESGLYEYKSISKALSEAFKRNGWKGATPTVLRDSLFSGTYYMLYTHLKTVNVYDPLLDRPSSRHYKNFGNGVLSGLVASIITNPLDVIKTRIQVDLNRKTVRSTIESIMAESSWRFFDGLFPRSLRRTLMAATTWTFYEMIMDSLKNK